MRIKNQTLMIFKHLLPAIAAALVLCTACVDPEYKLGNIKTEGTLFRNLEVPIGNFETITLETILKAQGAELVPTPLQPVTYTLRGWAQISGVNFNFDDEFYFKTAELHTVILNTLPVDMDFSVTALDADEQPCQDVTVSVKADASPMIVSGTPTRPSENPVILRLECRDRYMTLETLRLTFTGKTGAGFEGETPAMDQGITLTKVSLKMPEGFIVNIEL